MPPSKVQAKGGQAPAFSKGARKPPQVSDDNVMGTNSASGLSKRSVEHLYYPDEPSYFRFFITRNQRRSPLINRGYLVRMKAVSVIVQQFLRMEAPQKRKVIVNLGCGSDVLPWKLNQQYPQLCEDARFVDVDHPDLMLKKRQVVLQTPELKRILGLHTTGDLPTILRSDKYCQVGCNMARVDVLASALASVFDPAECTVLFIAEVSITYMETVDANAIIRWTSTLPQARFCLVEQILPEGPDHPFANNMLRHFSKLKSPIISVRTYPTVPSQARRFRERGWREVRAWTLWEAWASDMFFTPEERMQLDAAEPFDEWEELAIFGSHYIVLRASNHDVGHGLESEIPCFPSLAPCKVATSRTDFAMDAPRRKFGTAMVLGGDKEAHCVAHILGEGDGARLRSCDMYGLGIAELPLDHIPLDMPPARVCHTLTDLGPLGTLLAGGRTSPARVLQDCWLFDKNLRRWQKTDPLPLPLYRHTAARLGGSAGVLVFGGKTESGKVSNSCFVYGPSQGWLECDIKGVEPAAAFGACLAARDDDDFKGGNTFYGILAGGISQDGLVIKQTLLWELALRGCKPAATFKDATRHDAPDSLSLLHRFGAQCVSVGRHVVVVGGVIGDSLLPRGLNVVVLGISRTQCDIVARVPLTAGLGPSPFLVGASVVPLGKDGFGVLGGGAVCFAMGAFWETKVYTCIFSTSLQDELPQPLALRFLDVLDFPPRSTQERIA